MRETPLYVEDINDLPTPDYDGLPLHLYLSPDIVALLSTDRGCYWRRCAFCAASKTMPGYRPRRVDLILEDMKRVSRQLGSLCFFLANEAMPPARMKALAEALAAEGLDFIWASEARLEKSFTPEACRTLVAGGCRRLLFGLESGSQRVLDIMDKGITLEQASGVIRNFHDAGASTHVYLMVGFPTETRQEAQETLDFVARHRDVIDTMDYSRFELGVDSRVYANPTRYGICRMDSHVGGLFGIRDAYDYQVTQGMTPQELGTDVFPAGRRFLRRMSRSRRSVRDRKGLDSIGRLTGNIAILNYLAHFESTHPAESSSPSVRSDTESIDVHQIIDLAPRPCTTVSVRSVNDAIAVLFNPVDGKTTAAPAMVSALLPQCDGQRTVDQILTRLASDTDDSDFVKQYYEGLNLCTELVRQGILVLAPPNAEDRERI